MIGMVSSPHHVFLARGVEHVGDPTELDEDKYGLVPRAEIPTLIAAG